MPPHFSKVKQHVPSPLYLNDDDDEPAIPEDVYDVPPPILRDKGVACPATEEVYDTPANLRSAARPQRQDLYDFPREHDDRGDRSEQNIYDVPPQVEHKLDF